MSRASSLPRSRQRAPSFSVRRETLDTEYLNLLDVRGAVQSKKGVDIRRTG